MASTEAFLFLSSCATAIIHALIPDHWLPFALIARAQGWSDRRTVAVAGLTGVVHVMVSVAVGGPVIFLGTAPARDLAERAGRSLESVAGLLLVVFGLAYGVWAHRREARAHRAPPAGAAGPGHAHVHGHLLERWFRGTLGAGALVAVVGISPCVLLVPILFASSARGPAALLASGLGFAACTVGTMIGVTLFATRGMRRFDLPFFTRYGDLLSGLLIAVIGAFVMIREG